VESLDGGGNNIAHPSWGQANRKHSGLTATDR
jgi:hypothetical protein